MQIQACVRDLSRTPSKGILWQWEGCWHPGGLIPLTVQALVHGSMEIFTPISPPILNSLEVSWGQQKNDQNYTHVLATSLWAVDPQAPQLRVLNPSRNVHWYIKCYYISLCSQFILNLLQNACTTCWPNSPNFELLCHFWKLLHQSQISCLLPIWYQQPTRALFPRGS